MASSGRIQAKKSNFAEQFSRSPAYGNQSLAQRLDAWADEAHQEKDEDRHEAVRRIKAWVQAGDVNAWLNLSSLRLTALPADLPTGLQWLDVGENQLANLPDSLPAGLLAFKADGNQLTSLPDALPAPLQTLDVSCNRLASIPDNLPKGLRVLNTSYNQLISISETLLTQLDSECMVYLEGNPFSERAQTHLATALFAADYAGPKIRFDVSLNTA